MRVALLCLLAAGCHRAEAPVEGGFRVPLVAEAPESDAVVATVDGRPIRASDIAAQARAAGTTTKQALDDLITAEALAAVAADRKLDRDPAALDAARQAAVRRYLKTTFESEVTPATVPDRLVRRFYNQNVNRFDHSEYADVWHILVPVRKGATDEEKKAARAVAEQIAAKARKVGSADAFKALAAEVTSPRPQVEQIITARDGWVERPFSEAAFVQLKKPGDTSGVVETSYGYHVEYLNRFIPPQHDKIDDVAANIRQIVFPSYRREEFLQWTADVAKAHQIAVHPERLK